MEKQLNLQTQHISSQLISKHREALYGISILWIMLFHAKLCNCYYPPILQEIFKYGNMGCDIFLFLSAICLYFSYTKENQIYLYMTKRIIRIFVPIILICSVYWLPLFIKGKITLYEIFSRYTTLNFWITGDQQIWFLSLLLVLYFLYPYFYQYIFFSGRSQALHTMVLISLAIVISFTIKHEAPSFYENTEIALTRFPIFILGCFAGKIVYEKNYISSKFLYLSIITVIIIFPILKVEVLYNEFSNYFYLIGGVAITFLLANCLDAISTTIIYKFFIFLGNISIELYLTHIILIRLYKHSIPIKYVEGHLWRYFMILFLSTIIAFVMSSLNKKISSIIKYYLLQKAPY